MKINADFSELEAYIDEATRKAIDLRPALESIAVRWFRSNKAMFTLKGKGGYEDLSENYKSWKEKILGSAYPIGRLTGQLEASLTNMNDQNAIKNFVGTSTVFLGSEAETKNGDPYVFWLQHGTKFMPARPPVLINPSFPSGTADQKTVDLWRDIIAGYILKPKKGK